MEPILITPKITSLKRELLKTLRGRQIPNWLLYVVGGVACVVLLGRWLFEAATVSPLLKVEYGLCLITSFYFIAAAHHALRELFKNEDFWITLKSPLNNVELYFGRLAETLFATSEVVFAFMVPGFLCIGILTGAGFVRITVGVISLGLLLPGICAMGVLSALAIQWILSFRKGVFFLTSFVAAASICAFSIPGYTLGVQALEFVDHGMGSWLTAILIGNEPLLALRAMGLTLLFSLSACSVSYLVFSWCYRTLCSKAMERARGSGQKSLRLALPGCFKACTQALLEKELRCILRDRLQISYMMTIIVGILAWFSLLPMPSNEGVANWVRTWLHAEGSWVGAALVCGTCAYRSFSNDSSSLWMILSSPVSLREVLQRKALIYSVMVASLAICLILFGQALIGFGPRRTTLALLGTIPTAYCLAGVSVVLGAIFSRPRSGGAELSGGGSLVCITMLGAVTSVNLWFLYWILLYSSYLPMLPGLISGILEMALVAMLNMWFVRLTLRIGTRAVLRELSLTK